VSRRKNPVEEDITDRLDEILVM
jgi:hypothetical protein